MENKTKFWDPVEGELSQEGFKKECGDLRKKLEELMKNPFKVKKERRKRLLIAVVVTILCVVFFIQIHPGLFMIAVIAWVYFGLYINEIAKLQKDLIKITMSDEEGWLYSPNPRREKWMKLRESFRRFFNKGDEAQALQDEIWGEFETSGKKRNFWTGVFDYTVVTRDSKGRRQTHDYHENIFALRLPKKLNTDFCLVPEHIGHKILNFFTRKEIDTEYNDFNKAFAFYYDGKKVESELEIVKTLSPAVQEKIMDLKKKRGNLSMWIRDDIILVSFKELLLKTFHTDFFKKVEIDKRDTEKIRKTLNEMFEIGGGIISYLD